MNRKLQNLNLSTGKLALLLLIGCTLMFQSCKEEAPKTEAAERKDGYTKNLKSKQDSLFQEVMDGHDVGMAKMGQVSGYLKRVKASLDSANKKKSVYKDKIIVMESVNADLSQAEYSMN